jgi:hypothetical protein
MSTTAASRVMARGREIELRRWERDPAGERAFEPDAAREHVAYVQAGALIVSVGLGHSFEVLEPAIVVEAISPSDRSN